MNGLRLEARGIEKRFGRVTALAGLDFEIEPGVALAVLGANGAGKSSLLRILAGLSRPSGGSFEAHMASPNGEPERRLSRDGLRGQVGYVGHATLLYGELTARENLLFAARLHAQAPDRSRLDRILEEAALDHVADRRVGGFSRGMAQRLSIARATVHDPSILLLDEPFTGLDEHSADRLARQLARLRGEGRTILLVTHEPARAFELTDRALVLHAGRLRASPARGNDAFTTDALRETLRALASEQIEGAAA